MELDQHSLATILRSSDLNVTKEIIVADTLEAWLNHTQRFRQNHINNHLHFFTILFRSKAAISQLVPLVRLEFINTIDLLNLPKTHPTIASSPGFEGRLSTALTNQVFNDLFVVLFYVYWFFNFILRLSRRENSRFVSYSHQYSQVIHLPFYLLP